MKKIFYLVALVLAVAATSCNGSGNNSASTASQASQAQLDAAPTSVSHDSVANAGEASQGADVQNFPKVGKVASQDAKPLEAPKVQPKPESETDKLLKQYNEEMVALIEKSKNGANLDNATNQKFLELQSKLEQLDKSGKLSETQQELFKVTNNAYNMLKNKK